jgi:hypothetical protein
MCLVLPAPYFLQLRRIGPPMTPTPLVGLIKLLTREVTDEYFQAQLRDHRQHHLIEHDMFLGAK